MLGSAVAGYYLKRPGADLAKVPKVSGDIAMFRGRKRSWMETTKASESLILSHVAHIRTKVFVDFKLDT